MTSTDAKYAIIKVGGQQFMVRAGDKIKVDEQAGEKGSSIVFDQVLVVSENGNAEVGSPLLSGRKVSAKILATVKGPKVIAFKKKRRKGFTWKKGHRQIKSEVLIEAIA